MQQSNSVMSMTAIGSCDFEIGHRSYHLEIKSVNAKAFEIKIFLPEHLSSCELVIRNAIKGINRGKIELRILQNKQQQQQQQQSLIIDSNIADSYISAIFTIQKLFEKSALPTPTAYSPIDLLQLPGMFQNQQNQATETSIHYQLEPEQQAPLLEALQQALHGHLEMRKKEGSFLTAVLLRHLSQIEEYQRKILNRIPEFQRELKSKTKERVMNLILDIYQIINDNEMNALHIDQNRIATELGILVEKTDITEEMDRLSSHIHQMKELIINPSEQGIGRKCDFICQELLREVNTTGSKANDVEILKQVIDLKVEIERLREQVQNIE